MLACRMMDESLVLPICLHGGPVSLSRLPELAEGTKFENDFGLEPGVHAARLRGLSCSYGATGVAAVEGEQIVGLLRFFPSRLQDVVACLCPQDEPHARSIAALDVSKLPSFEDLCPKALRIDCFQVVSSHRSRGIGRAMLQKAIEWCREAGWEEIEASGVEHIFPIMAWSGQMSAQTLKRHGFEAEGSRGGHTFPGGDGCQADQQALPQGAQRAQEGRLVARQYGCLLDALS